MNIKFCDIKSRPGIKVCGRCKKPFRPIDNLRVIEVQNSAFRGEDSVYALCVPCWNRIHEWAIPSLIECGIIQEVPE